MDEVNAMSDDDAQLWSKKNGGTSQRQPMHDVDKEDCTTDEREELFCDRGIRIDDLSVSTRNTRLLGPTATATTA